MDKSYNNEPKKKIDKDILQAAGKVIQLQNEGKAPNLVHIKKLSQEEMKQNEKAAKEAQKQARYTAKINQMALAAANGEKTHLKLKKAIIGSLIAAGVIAAVTLSHDRFEKLFSSQRTISTSNAAVLMNDNEKLEEAYVNRSDVADLIELTNEVNKIIENKNEDNLSPAQVKELANETREVTADILKGKAVRYYNQDKEDSEKIDSIDNVIISAPNASDGNVISIYQSEKYGFPNITGENRNHIMTYDPSEGFERDAYLDYANLCLSLDHDTVTFNDITNVLKSTNKASSQTFKKKFLGDYELDDSVVTKKEIRQYEERQEQQAVENNLEHDQSFGNYENDEYATNDILGASVISSEDIDIDINQPNHTQEKDYDDEER